MSDHKQVGIIGFLISIGMVPTMIMMIVITFREWRRKAPVDGATTSFITVSCIIYMIYALMDILHFLAHGAE